MTYRWDEFEINYYYPVELWLLFRAFATGQGLKSFFIDDIAIMGKGGNDLITTGDNYAWRWRHGYSLQGKFTAVVENERIEFTFGEMHVAITFREVADGCLLQLKQTNIPTGEEDKPLSHMNCRICWTFFLTNLKSVLMSGMDLRDTDPARASSFEVGYRAAEAA